MEIEQLICEQCNAQWSRQKARGRKPKLCSKCSISLSPTLIPNDEEEDLIEDIPLIEEPPLSPTKYKPNSKWKCISCGAKVTIGIGINDIPTHKCVKRLNRMLPLELA